MVEDSNIQIMRNDAVDGQIISQLREILESYNKVHTDENSRQYVRTLFDSLRTAFAQVLNEKGTQDVVIKWSFPKPSWAFVPWIAFLDKKNEENMTSGIYGCILFKSNMSGVYLTLIQGITQYKDLPKNERIKQLNAKNTQVRKKLNYLSTHGFSLDDKIDLLAPPGSVGEGYDKGTILYKYYPKESLPEQASLIRDIQTVVDAYRIFSAEEKQLKFETTVHDPTVYKKGSDMPDPEISFLDYLGQRGFVFEKEVVVSFLLSLKVKPFVILTGPSGCGKTKLAQLFAQFQAERDGKKDRDFIVMDVKVGKSANHEGWTFPRNEFFNYYPELRKYQGSYDIEVDGIRARGDIELLTRLFYESNEKIKKRLEELAKIDPSRRVTLKIFVPSNGNSTYEIVPVGANWTENRHIVGFYNLLTKDYQRTKALDLILKAQMKENERIPCFLILDEMNLSHVERYFADFLSAIESDEKIPLHSNSEENTVPSDIRLSPNLSIIGTVNVDETTYMFSPKVLDRANTIEILAGSISDYMLGCTKQYEIIGNMAYLENPLIDATELRSLTVCQIKGLFGVTNVANGLFWDEYCKELERFQKNLREAGLDFGFRVVNEISRYLLAAWRFEGKPNVWDNWQHYFDMQIKQKMLPKIHGSERALGGLIENLFHLCVSGPISKPPREYTSEELAENAQYYSSAVKLREMDSMLYRHRYVSFTR